MRASLSSQFHVTLLSVIVLMQLSSLSRADVDLNADTHSDIIFQNQTTGALVYWLMNGSAYLGGDVLPNQPLIDWQLIDSADFNGDGKPDLLFQNSRTGALVIWYMDGLTYLGGAQIPITPDAGWKVVGVGDFNGDGKSDLVFQNSSTNQIVIWYMDNTIRLGGALLPITPNAGYRVVGVADFNGDGKPDLVFQNQNGGDIVLWYMDHTTRLGGAPISSVPPNGYQVVGLGDFNADGKPDLVLQNVITGQVLYWYVNGTMVVGTGGPPYAPYSLYKVAGLRSFGHMVNPQAWNRSDPLVAMSFCYVPFVQGVGTSPVIRDLAQGVNAVSASGLPGANTNPGAWVAPDATWPWAVKPTTVWDNAPGGVAADPHIIQNPPASYFSAGPSDAGYCWFAVVQPDASIFAYLLDPNSNAANTLYWNLAGAGSLGTTIRDSSNNVLGPIANATTYPTSPVPWLAIMVTISKSGGATLYTNFTSNAQLPAGQFRVAATWPSGDPRGTWIHPIRGLSLTGAWGVNGLQAGFVGKIALLGLGNYPTPAQVQVFFTNPLSPITQ